MSIAAIGRPRAAAAVARPVLPAVLRMLERRLTPFFGRACEWALQGEHTQRCTGGGCWLEPQCEGGAFCPHGRYMRRRWKWKTEIQVLRREPGDGGRGEYRCGPGRPSCDARLAHCAGCCARVPRAANEIRTCVRTGSATAVRTDHRCAHLAGSPRGTIKMAAAPPAAGISGMSAAPGQNQFRNQAHTRHRSRRRNVQRPAQH